MTIFNLDSRSFWGNSMDYFHWLYPGTILNYVVPIDSPFRYFRLENLLSIEWYSFSIWKHLELAVGIIILNYSFWTYWIWHGLKRRFSNVNATLLSKPKSYWFSNSLIAILLGFVLKNNYKYFEDYADYAREHLDNFGIFFLFQSVIFLLLIFALSPHRQTLQDWMGYRHQNTTSKRRKLIFDLLWGEKSPATLAIAIHGLMNIIIILPVIYFLPLKEYKIPVLLGLLFNVSILLIYASIAQLILLIKSPKRFLWMGSTLATLIIVPIVIVMIFKIETYEAPWMYLFSFVPLLGTEKAVPGIILFSLLGQGLIITLVNLQFVGQIKQIGQSQTKALLT
jgi:hypothetical protein